MQGWQSVPHYWIILVLIFRIFLKNLPCWGGKCYITEAMPHLQLFPTVLFLTDVHWGTSLCLDISILPPSLSTWTQICVTLSCKIINFSSVKFPLLSNHRFKISIYTHNCLQIPGLSSLLHKKCVNLKSEMAWANEESCVRKYNLVDANKHLGNPLNYIQNNICECLLSFMRV